MLPAVLHNYETVKLCIQNPNIVNGLLLFMLLGAALLSVRRTDTGTEFFSISQTDQLRGAAILLVIIGHLWMHTAEKGAKVNLGEEAVSIFLMLSGYGLTISNKHKTLSLRHFIARRIKRVMLPYWIVTFVLLVTDYLLLHRSYSVNTIILTAAGINVTEVTWHIDYVRWFITLLLVWYVLFFFSITCFAGKNRIIVLFGCAAIIYVFDYYLFRFDWVQLFAFPTGCAIGHYYDELQVYFTGKARKLTLCAVLVVGYVLLYKVVLQSYMLRPIPYIICKFFIELNGIILSIALMIILAYGGLKNYYSSFCLFCGKLSYELYLTHGAFLIKYNPIVKHTGTLRITCEFTLFIAFMVLLSWIVHKLISALISAYFLSGDFAVLILRKLNLYGRD